MQPPSIKTNEGKFPLSLMEGSCAFPFKAPWSSSFEFHVEDAFLRVVNKYVPEDQDPTDQETATDGIILIRVGIAAPIDPSITIDRLLTVIQFQGIQYNVCTYMKEKEYTFVAILQPEWGRGGFKFCAPMWLPPLEHFIYSHSNTLIEADQDVTDIRFAVSLTYSSREQTVATLVAIELDSMADPESDIECRTAFYSTEDAAKVVPFSIRELKRLSFELFNPEIEEM